jgi:glycosyltransferase involved in cell wall biosynthesis
LNIVQTTITYPPAVGGLDRYVKETSEGLAGRGHRVVVVTTDLEQPMSRKRLSIPPENRDLAEVHRLPTWRIPRIGFPFATAMPSVIAAAAPDLIHAHCILHSSAVFAWRAAKKARVPFILNTIFSPRSGWFWNNYLRLGRRMIADADCVIAISNFERELLLKAGFRGSRIEVLAPGVDLAPLKTPRTSIYSRYGLENNRVIVSLGRLAFGKRVDRLLQALPTVLRKHPDVRLFIAGPDYGDAGRLKEISRSLDLDSFVVFAGALSADDVASALQASTAFVMTTDFELFGITLIEAMAAGTAVIAPRVASVPNVVRDGETGILYEQKVEALAASLNSILGDEDLRRHLVREGRIEADTRFDFQRNLDALERIYADKRKN